ncbi:MAG TPA: hypothetical protein VK592_04520 [Candidatus Dormibacteraeota bacterium]|nr:hypothetical protein [Candidatus Dormibacteraeota bacterium]
MSSTAEMLGEIASQAAIERTTFLVDAARQLDRFLKANAERIRELGGLVLIDDDPDYLSIAPDSTFRSRTRYQDEATGEWVSETEVIESGAELVELYNPAEVYAAFAEAARQAAGLPEEPTGVEDLAGAAGLAPDERVGAGSPYAGAADMWAASHEEPEEPQDADAAARLIYDLALTFQERSQQTEASLLEQFQDTVGSYTHWLGDTMIVDDDDERLTLQRDGLFRGEVIPEEEEESGRWKKLNTPDELVQFYDPTDVFGDLADSLAELYPSVAPEDESEA